MLMDNETYSEPDADGARAHTFMLSIPRDAAPAEDQVMAVFEQTLNGAKTGNKIIYMQADMRAGGVQ